MDEGAGPQRGRPPVPQRQPPGSLESSAAAEGEGALGRQAVAGRGQVAPGAPSPSPGHRAARRQAPGPASSWFVAAALLALAGCGRPEAPKADAAPLPVRVHVVGAAGAQPQMRATGTVRLRRETPLAFVADGRLVRLEVREGMAVRAGQLIAALDSQPFDSDVAAAEAAVRQAEAELQRQRRLFADGWVARARVDQQEAAAGAARAQRDAARFRQRYVRIVAPADGVVLRRLAEPGQTLAAGTPVLVLGELREGFVLRVPMTDREIAGLGIGQPAVVSFGPGGPPELRGQVVEIAGRADERTGSFRVEVALPGHPDLRSGLIGEARFAPRAPDPGRGPQPLQIPASALFAARADEGFVWQVRPEGSGLVVRAHMVRLGPVSAGGVAVAEGLKPGDRIVLGGVDRLADGMPVVVAATRRPLGTQVTRAPAATGSRP